MAVAVNIGAKLEQSVQHMVEAPSRKRARHAFTSRDEFDRMAHAMTDHESRYTPHDNARQRARYARQTARGDVEKQTYTPPTDA